MEAMGDGACFLDEEWGSLYKIFSEVESDLDFTHLLGNNNPQFSPDLEPNQNHFLQSSSSSDDLSNSSYGGNNYLDTLNHMTQLLNNEEQVSSLSTFDQFMAAPLSDDHATKIDDDAKRKKCNDNQTELPKKRARVLKNAEKGKRKVQPKKKKKIEEEKVSINVQSLSCETSDNESNDSQEAVNEASKEIVKINGKKRASRGAATDPQSLYARKRRERINERLRILQHLVPNGTKVDISTMLEEAVNYVKFLQLQIKLLSSDDMWMYAPLAYNGFDAGFYSSFSTYPQWQ